MSEDGFTLSELTVVIGLLGIILGVAWLGYSVSANGSALSDAESHTAQEISAPLHEAERRIMQQYDILIGYSSVAERVVTPTPYLLAFTTDRDNDGHSELNIIEATSANELVFSSAETVDSPSIRSFAWSDNNFNQATGTPLFTYYASDGSEITNMGLVETQARRVKVTIVTEYDGRQFSDSRTILFRNQ